MTEDRPIAPLYNRIYGDVVYWITFACCIVSLVGPMASVIWPENNAMNPYFTYALIFEGMTGVEIWMTLYGDWPWLHKVWWDNFFTGDGFTMFGMVIGCTVAFWALIPTIPALAREKLWIYVLFSLFVMFMILLSASGIFEVGG